MKDQLKKIHVEAVYGLTSRMEEALSKASKTDREWRDSAHPYSVTIRFNRKQMTIPFWMGSALTHEPNESDVLPCIFRDAQSGDMEFEEFCHEFGYDEDSRSAERTWKACKDLRKNVRRVFGDEWETIAQEVFERYE